MFEITVNDRAIEAEPGDTILAALTRAEVKVPTLCHMKYLTPTGACRICVVEVEGMRGLVPSCSYPVKENMKIHTHSPKVIEARKTIIELLMSNHPDNCLYCVRNGNCHLQTLAEEYGVRERLFDHYRQVDGIDMSSPSIMRDPDKCILCGKCIRVCEEIQRIACIDFVGRGSKTVVAPAFKESLNTSSCINCGQCIMVCPTGALREKSSLQQVSDAIADPDKIVVVQHAPSVSVSLAEEFGMKPGSDLSGLMTAALRKIGFDYVFDTAYSADVTIMEEATELVHRIQSGGILPMFTSCSPGWVKFVEEFYPEFIPNLSSCKSPQGMLGALIKTYFAEKKGIDPNKIFSVSVMPCTAKKFEVERPELGRNGVADLDAVLTVRELIRYIRMSGIDFQHLPPEEADLPFGERSTAGKIFGVTGGVMEAAIRTAHKLITGKELAGLAVEQVRGLAGIKEAKLKIGGVDVAVAVCNGIGYARKMLEQLKAGRKDLLFIEVMTCPGGCVGGGGQPISDEKMERIKVRAGSLYNIDQHETLRASHNNPAVQHLYQEYLEKPNSEKAHHLLHTSYAKRNVLI